MHVLLWYKLIMLGRLLRTFKPLVHSTFHGWHGKNLKTFPAASKYHKWFTYQTGGALQSSSDFCGTIGSNECKTKTHFLMSMILNQWDKSLTFPLNLLLFQAAFTEFKLDGFQTEADSEMLCIKDGHPVGFGNHSCDLFYLKLGIL